MKRRLSQCLEIIGLCLLFCLAETLIYDLGRAPLAHSLDQASAGPLARLPHHLLDRLAEWRAQTPELESMLLQLGGWTTAWALIKGLGFSWFVLRTLNPESRRRGAAPSGLAMAAQMIYLAIPGLGALGMVLFCAFGLRSPDPFAYWGLGLSGALWGMVKVSRDRSWAHLFHSEYSAYAPRHALAGIAAWVQSPGSMLMAWILWVTQMAVAAGPLYEQLREQPGPSDPRRAIPYAAAAFLIWALRLWQLHRAELQRRRSA